MGPSRRFARKPNGTGAAGWKSVILVDAAAGVAEPDLRVHIIEPTGLGQRIHRCGPLAAAAGCA